MKNILLFIAILVSFQTIAQQQMMFTQYMYNTQSFNPAYVGTQNTISAVLLAREQWVGFKDAPSSQTFTINMPIKSHKIGIGASVFNDMLGPVQEITAGVDFSYIIRVGDESKLSLGIKASASSYQLDFTKIKIYNGSDQSFSRNRRGDINPNFGAGIYYYTPKYYIGLSVPRLLKNPINIETDLPSSQAVGQEEIHWFLTAGYVMEIFNGLKFRPSLLVKHVPNVPMSIDLAGNFLVMDRLWAGASYRVGDAASLIAQYGITSNLWAGYSYGFSMSDISSYNTGTHEVMLMYDFSLSKKKFRSPRFF